MTASLREIARRMDPVRPPDRLRGRSTPWLDSGGTDVLAWLLRDDVVEAARSQPEAEAVGLGHRTDKGVDQVHRWPRMHVPAGSAPRSVSIRALARRHRDPSRAFRFLWYNTWLLRAVGFATKPLLERRADEIARAISDRPYDIAALCEVFSQTERDSISSIVGANHHFDWARGPEHSYQNSSGLFTLAIDRVRILEWKGMVFEYEGGGVDALAEKGVLHTELELAADATGFAPRIDLFTTHMHAEEPTARRRQLVELHDFIVERRKPTNPTIVAGDFNIDNRDPAVDDLFGAEYVALLNMLGQLGLSDAWLLRGGLASTTSVDEDPDHNVDYRPACLFDTANRFASCEDYPPFRPGSKAPVPGKRLDYVLVEVPREQHNVMIDIPRARRLPFFRASESVYALDPTHMFSDVPDTGPGTPSYMSDHLGLELELVVTPMAEVIAGMGGGG